MALPPPNSSLRGYANVLASRVVDAAVATLPATPANATAGKPSASLGSLPVEMLLEITHHLDVASLNKLASTNSFNHCALDGSREQAQAENRYVNALVAKLRSAHGVSESLPLIDRVLAYLSRTGDALTPNDDRLVSEMLGLRVMSGIAITGPLPDLRALANLLGALGRCLQARQGLPWPATHRQIHVAWRATAERLVTRTHRGSQAAVLTELAANMPPGSQEERIFSEGLLAHLARTRGHMEGRRTALWMLMTPADFATAALAQTRTCSTP